jgi:hypothetical protein
MRILTKESGRRPWILGLLVTASLLLLGSVALGQRAAVEEPPAEQPAAEDEWPENPRAADEGWAEIALLDGRLTVFGNAAGEDLTEGAARVCSSGVDAERANPRSVTVDLAGVNALLEEFGCDVTTFRITVDGGGLDVIVAAEDQGTVKRLQTLLETEGISGHAELDFAGSSAQPSGG